ncbi:glycosyltransferase [Paenarthrobacter sp. Z7-10]|uniref:glycosyltransferase n=1 Tax=Paenarthrobacter sp. Z7-10 TaxID=2787635 RepID=UPI0022A8DEF7|nr:glycosyltransferase [Paenarthrobacter sp. Z7-10]
MKVIVATRLFTPEVGAAAFRLQALVEGLIKAGADVRVITTRPPAGSQAFASEYRVSRWPVLRDSGGNVRGYLQYLSFDIPLFFRLLLAGRADVIVVEPPPTSGIVTSAVCWLRRIPYVYFSADVSSSAAKGIGLGGIGLKILTALERFVLRSAAGILAVSDGVKSEVLALAGNGIKVHVVGTGVDTSVFTPDGEHKTGQGRYFIYAGTMSEIQGAGVFVDAFVSIAGEYPDVRLFMFGQGVELEALKQRAFAAGPQIVFLPPAPGPDVAVWLRGAVANLASVRPGKGYDFAFATKSLAGLAAGAPAIYSGVGPMRQLVEDHRLGWTCDWDPDSVAGAMREAISGEPSVERRRELAAWVERHHSLHRVGTVAAGKIYDLLGRESALGCPEA